MPVGVEIDAYGQPQLNQIHKSESKRDIISVNGIIATTYPIQRGK